MKDCKMQGQALARLVVALAAALGLSGPSGAQTAPASPPAANEALAPVKVDGKRAPKVDTGVVNAAKSKVLSRNFASSCGFMSSYNPNDDAVTQAYMDSVGKGDSISNETERFNDTSPNGDASSSKVESGVEQLAPEQTDPNAPAAGCGKGDRSFAAGRNFIARKDKTLDQAFAALDNEEYAKAKPLFEAAYSKIGYEEAALMLGKLHLYGQGTPRSTEQAVRWLGQVVEARYDPVADRFKFNPGTPEAMNPRIEASLLLAKIYLVGLGTSKDPAQARKWYAKALDYGFVPAGSNLGQAALAGYGGKKDAVEARDYWREAAEAGYAPAQLRLARLYDSGADGVPRDQQRANAWYAQAAKAGQVDALLAVARIYDAGTGVPADPAKAIVYYKEAALKGNAEAQSALATFFYEGQQVPQDLATARKLFQAAAMRGQADAMFNLAVMSTRGEGGPKDLAMGYVWLNLARSAGHDAAEAALKAVTPLLTPQDRNRADALLKP